VTFAEAAEEYLTWLEVDRERKPSTLRDYRSILRTHILPAFGSAPIEDLTPAQLDRWRRELDPALSNRTTIKILTLLYGILERARRTHGLPVNPARDIEKPTQRRSAGIDVFSVEEVMAVLRAADSERTCTRDGAGTSAACQRSRGVGGATYGDGFG
jgi:site-specific recombinase XerC